MKQFIISLFILFNIQQSFSQIVNPLWETCLGGTEWDEGKGIISTGDSYFVISTTQSNDGDVSNNHGAWDLWLTNVDKSGYLLSEKTFGGSYFDGGFVDILKLNDSVFYITAQTKSIDGDISNNPWPGHSNIWTLMINKEGEILWESVHGGSKIDWMRDMEVTNDGGLIALSLSNSDDGDVSNPNGSDDLWLIKLNSSGETEWDFSLGGEGGEEGASITQTSDGGYLVTGATDGKGGGNFDNNCNFHGDIGNFNFGDAWVIKLDSNLNIDWQECYGGTYHDLAFNNIEVPDGYIILGKTMSNDGDVSGLHSPPGPNSEYGGDIWVFKIDKQGNLLWQNCLGGLYNDYARNIFTTSDGGFMIIGTTESADGDIEGFNGIEPGRGDDVWFAKIDSLGQLTWQYCYGGLGREYLYRGVHQKSDYNYVITIGTKSDEWQCSEDDVAPPDLRVVELYDTTVSIDETVSNSINVKVSPNPAREYIVFNYDMHDINEYSNLSILNSNGKLIDKFELKNNNGKIRYDCSHLNAGIYFYSFSFSNTYKSGRFIIVK